jgi:hypothetical protein
MGHETHDLARFPQKQVNSEAAGRTGCNDSTVDLPRAQKKVQRRARCCLMWDRCRSRGGESAREEWSVVVGSGQEKDARGCRGSSRW